MNFGQIIKNNIRKSFLGKPYTITVGETIPRTFSKNTKLSIPLDQ